ncbi:MAG: nucleotide exchange factor GrpE [Candidatus Nomurabacteria bacterium]|nr:MAG: nucleotide exchange factor GrpE [Candidatus Nomurabacteria bacterium]
MSTNENEVQEDTSPEMSTLQKKAEEYLAGWQRAKADYQNLKRQNEKEREELMSMTTGALILDLLPVKTNFDLAWQHLPEDLKDHAWVKGMEHVQKQFTEFLQTLGISSYQPSHEAFDPSSMEAIEHTADAEVPEGQVIRTTEPGYRMRDKVIRPAKVVVSSGPSQES